MYRMTHLQGIVLRVSDGAVIPADTATTEYVEYLAWVAAGNTPDPYVAPPTPIPNVVEMAQARLALLQGGYLATVDAAIAAMTGPEGDAARIEWEFRATVRRDSALTQAMAVVLGLDEAELDALFTLAATL